MREHSGKIWGGILLVLAFVVLLIGPTKSFSFVHFVAFLACFVSGVLLIMGLIGPDPVFVKLRREAGVAPGSRSQAALDVRDQVFRYAPGRWVKGGVYLLGLVLAGGGSAAGAFFPGTPTEHIGVALPGILGGSGLCWYMWRHGHLRVRVTSQGLESRQYFHTVRIAWEDVLLLLVRDRPVLLPSGIGLVMKDFAIYSRRSKVVFTDHLDGAEDLRALVSRVTGLQWQ